MARFARAVKPHVALIPLWYALRPLSMSDAGLERYPWAFLMAAQCGAFLSPFANAVSSSSVQVIYSSMRASSLLLVSRLGLRARKQRAALRLNLLGMG